MPDSHNINKTSLGRAVRFLLVATVLSCAASLQAVDIAVTHTHDIADDFDGSCTLREAIRSANTDTAIDACLAGSGYDTVALPTGTYTLGIAGTDEDACATGDLDIVSDMKIAGGNGVVVDGNGLDRVFDIRSPTVVIEQVEITGGQISSGGGGVSVIVSAGVTLESCVVTYNQSSNSGGGISAHGSLTVNRSTISANSATLLGGGLWLSSPQATINESLITTNISTNGDAGGIYVDEMLTLVNSTVSGNYAKQNGGGIEVVVGTIDIQSSTIVLNNADSNNTGAGSGGGVNNFMGTVNIRNSIIAVNIDPNGIPDCWGNITSGGYNLIGNTASCTEIGDPTGNVLDQAPEIGDLAFNGGPTRSHALLDGSPAIDVANPAAPGSGGSSCPTVDQRGFDRPKDGTGNGSARCDIGAFEFVFDGLIFQDGFESGDLGGWSSATRTTL